MDEHDAAIKEQRRILRLMQDHLAQAHLSLGSQQEHIGLVDVIHHPDNSLGHLNYVTPRRNTAWVPAPSVQQGLDRLRSLNRTMRVNYVEGLFLPIFAKSLRDLGLVVEQETSLMSYTLADLKLPEEDTAGKDHPVARVTAVNDQDGIAQWWYVWRNAYFDVLTGSIEPIYVGRDVQAIALGRQADLLLYREGFPVGVARLTFHNQTAHLATLAIMKEARAPEMIRMLYYGALGAAKDRGCELLFTSGDTEADRKLCRELGFVDSGSMVCYAEPAEETKGDLHDVNLAQPVLAL